MEQIVNDPRPPRSERDDRIALPLIVAQQIRDLFGVEPNLMTRQGDCHWYGVLFLPTEIYEDGSKCYETAPISLSIFNSGCIPPRIEFMSCQRDSIEDWLNNIEFIQVEIKQ